MCPSEWAGEGSYTHLNDTYIVLNMKEDQVQPDRLILSTPLRVRGLRFCAWLVRGTVDSASAAKPQALFLDLK